MKINIVHSKDLDKWIAEHHYLQSVPAGAIIRMEIQVRSIRVRILTAIIGSVINRELYRMIGLLLRAVILGINVHGMVIPYYQLVSLIAGQIQ